jgi:hypothetical protein
MSFRRPLLLLLTVLMITVASCSRIKSKGQELADTAAAAGQELLDTVSRAGKEYAKDAADKVMPRFDSYTPDTKYNKERFAEFINVPLTPDVKNIYCYDESIGIDASYQFAFNCDSSTAQKIIETHQLKPDSEKKSGISREFDWWNVKKIEQLDCYTREEEQRFFTHFWYDEAEHKAYFNTYDL